MKRISRIFFLALTAVIVFSSLPISASAESNLDGKTIVCFGDSLTQGTYYWVNSGLDVYPDLLADNLPDSTVINAGVRGDSTYNALLRYKNDVIAKNPDIVIICFGMNDQAWEVQYNRPIQTLEKYESQLTTMITDIQAVGADVILVTPNPVYEAAYTPTAYNNYEYGLMPEYCDAMRRLALELGCGLVDLNLEVSKRGISAYVSSDGIHQTEAGHKLYSDCITAYLKAAYDNVNRSRITVTYKTAGGNRIASGEYIGAAGARIRILAPDIVGHQASTKSLETMFVTGEMELPLTYISDLEIALAKAGTACANSYGEPVIKEIRALCENGRKMLSPDNTEYTPENMADAAAVILNALSAKGENTFLKSLGASYTTTDPNYYFGGDTSDTRYFDDGVRLTDGIKATPDGFNQNGNNYYSAWSSTASIILDLGEGAETNVFRVYAASCADWGISVPSGVLVEYSDDGKSFTAADTKVTRSDVITNYWCSHAFTAKSESIIEARYVKITIPGGFVWIDEVEALLDVKPIENIAYINGFDSRIYDGDSKIFTCDYGNLSTANLRYTVNLVAKWSNSQKAYIVSEVFEGNGNELDRTLKDGEFLIAVHYSTTVSESESAYILLLNAKKGQKIIFNGVDTETKTVDVLSYLSLAEGESEPDYDVNSDGKTNMFDYLSIKSVYFGSSQIDDEIALRADVNADGKVNMFDYLAVKKHILT